jgi:hypothetical protein
MGLCDLQARSKNNGKNRRVKEKKRERINLKNYYSERN